MKKIVLFLIVGILVLSGLNAVATPSEKIQHSEAKKIIFSKPIIKEEEQYVTIDIKEANGFLMEQNKPMLPSYTHTFTFPLGTKIDNVACEKYDVKQQSLDRKILPTPLAIQIGTTVKNQETTLYKEEPYPEVYYEYDIGQGINRNHERAIFVKVSVYPVKYYPAQNMMEYAENMKVTVSYTPPSDPFVYDETYKFVILTSNGFVSQLMPLVDHKNNRGISTKLVALNDIYYGAYFPAQGRDDPEKIKYFIKNAIENWGTTYVLLVGGSDYFPARETHVQIGEDDDEIFISDLYYADIYNETQQFETWDTNNNDVFAEYEWGDDKLTDELDLYPDVYLSRIPCIDETEVTTIVNKIKNYENNEAYAQSWFTNIVVIGGDSAPKDDDNVDEGEYVNQAVLDLMSGFIPTKIWDSNRKLSGISPNGVQNINNAINNGCGFVDWSGHGAPYIWTTYPHNGDRQTLPTPWGTYTNSNIEDDLNNGDKLPIVMCGGCSLGKYNANDNCFAYAYLSNPNGGGIASYGATGLGWIYIGKYVIRDLVEGLIVKLFKAYSEGAITFGEILLNGLNDYIEKRMDGLDYKTLEEWHSFGDPTLAIADESQPPVKPDAPAGSNSGTPGTSYEYSASTTDPDGDKISYIFDWGDDTYSNWIGPVSSGQTVTASHSWSVKGTYQVKVLAKDVHGVLGEWSEPNSVTMPKSKQKNPELLEKILDMFPILKYIISLLAQNQ